MSKSHQTGLAKLPHGLEWLMNAIGGARRGNIGASPSADDAEPAPKFLIFAHHKYEQRQTTLSLFPSVSKRRQSVVCGIRCHTRSTCTPEEARGQYKYCHPSGDLAIGSSDSARALRSSCGLLRPPSGTNPYHRAVSWATGTVAELLPGCDRCRLTMLYNITEQLVVCRATNGL